MAMRVLNCRGIAPSKLILAVPLEPYPGCGQISDFLDIWSHPILGAKWRDTLQGTVILAQPTRIVVSGLHGPMHRIKNIALFTLAPTNGREPERQLVDWRNTIFKYDVGPVIIVDVPETHAHEVREHLATASVPGVLRIDAPRPSASSMSAKRRSVVHIHVERTVATPLFLEMVMPWLRKGLRDYEALVGCTTTVSNTSTLLMDVSSPSASLTHSEGWWSAIAVSPRLVLIETRCDAAWWQEELTTKWRADPARAAEKIRFRPSSQLAQKTTTFAKISATPDQIAAARVRAQHDTPGLTTWRVTLRIELGTTGQSDIWLPDCLEDIARRSGLTLRQALHDRATDIHEWRPILNYEGAWTGGVTIQLASEGEVRTLHHAAHGQGIQVQQCSAIVEITSTYVVLDAYDGRDSSPFYHPGGQPTVPMPLPTA